MCTFTVSYRTDNTTGTTGYKVLYRVAGSTTWTSFLSSGSPAVITSLTNNYIYDVEVQNLNGHDNPVSTIMQGIGITDPMPLLSPTNSSIGFSFNNLSSFMTSYTVAIATAANPGTILQSNEFSPQAVISGTFSGLSPLTTYALFITCVASEFSQQFRYNAVTTELASCAAPVSASGYLSSGNAANTNLVATWVSPTPLPTNGFEVSYRLKGVNNYLTFISSGTTGTNSISLPVSSFGNYEGYVQSLCSSGNTSIGQPFGINSYVPISVVISVRPDPLNYVATMTTRYANPYPIIVTGTFISSSTGSHNYTATYPANSTSAVVALSGSATGGNEFITSYTISSVQPSYDRGGALQQFDSVLTPGYFSVYSPLLSSGTSSWNGNPALLPSFTLDRFEITEQDTLSNVLAGILSVSWIYDHLFMAANPPYNTLTLEIQDPADNSVMGSTSIVPSPLGVRNSTIAMSKTVTAITVSNPFNFIVRRSDGVVIGSPLSFYLPAF